MTKEEKIYKQSKDAWILTQENSIKSCNIIINYARANIKNLQTQIRLEKKERNLKIKLLEEVKKRP